MVREATITQEDVNAAADHIRSSGKKPTARAIREILGSGSMDTILTCLRVWNDCQIRSPESPVVLPLTLQNALVGFINQEIAAAKAVIETDLATVQQANGDLIFEAQRQTLAIEAGTKEIESLTAKQSELYGRMVQLVTDLEVARNEAEEQRQAAEKARTEQAKFLVRLEGVPRLESEIERLQEALEVERVARVKSEKDSAVAIAKLEKTNAQVQDLQTRLTQAETEVAQAGDKATSLWEQLLGAKASVT